MPINTGHAFFSALKFTSTSYNNEGVKFHLLIVLYLLEDENDKNGIPKVLNSIISPPIFVDSRKSARDQNYFFDRKISYYTDLFLPCLIDKTYIKRENKKKNE